jgi:hypothetical protein
MRHASKAVLVGSAFICAASFSPTWSGGSDISFSVPQAQARVGRPATPMSAAGVARRHVAARMSVRASPVQRRSEPRPPSVRPPMATTEAVPAMRIPATDTPAQAIRMRRTITMVGTAATVAGITFPLAPTTPVVSRRPAWAPMPRSRGPTRRPVQATDPGATCRETARRVGWVEPFAKPINQESG